MAGKIEKYVMVNLRTIRKASGMTLKYLAQQVGIGYTNICSYEAGKKAWGRTVFKLAKALNTTAFKLCGCKVYDSGADGCGAQKVLAMLGDGYLDSNNSGIVVLQGWAPIGARRLGGHRTSEI